MGVDHEVLSSSKKKKVDHDVWEGCVRVCVCMLQHCQRRFQKELRMCVDNER